MIVLTLPYPLSANKYWRPVTINGHVTIVPTKEAKAWKESAAWRAKAQGLRAPILGRVSVFIALYPQRPQDWAKRVAKDPLFWDDTVRCLDLDNAKKVLYDALEGVAFTNDSRVFIDGGERMEPDGEARMVVTITPYVREVNPQADLLGAAA